MLSAPALPEDAPLQAQKRQGHRRLRFMPPLEEAFQRDLGERLRLRARPVAASALLLFIVYCFLDVLMFPRSLWEQTVAARLGLVCPVILGIWMLSYRCPSPLRFLRFYALSYLGGGLGMVLLIYLARRQGIDMPYDGILLLLIFGYFLMGLPFRSVALVSSVTVLAYLWVEWSAGTEARKILGNAFFALTANGIGMVGAWLQEHGQRTHFLDRRLLDNARRRAEADSEQKNRFIAAASHDLRQPLNLINLLVEHLALEPGEIERTRIQHQLREAVNHFNRLLASLLDISRLREGLVKPETETVDVAQALKAFVETCRQQAEDQGVFLLVEPVPTGCGVQADPVLLHRILQNLTANALEHSGAEQIRVAVRVEGPWCVFTLADDGRGLPPEARDQVFEAFYRQTRDAGNHRGLGLGLAIVKELAVLMGGNVRLVAGQGKGACFEIRLPRQSLAPKEDASRSPAEEREGEARGGGILVVEDQEQARHSLVRLLASWGFEAQGCGRGEEALARLARRSFDVLITDLHLPDTDGWSLVDAAARQWPGMGLVMVTADAGQREHFDRARGLWLLHKPLTPARLRQALNRLLRRRAPQAAGK